MGPRGRGSATKFDLRWWRKRRLKLYGKSPDTNGVKNRMRRLWHKKLRREGQEQSRGEQ